MYSRMSKPWAIGGCYGPWPVAPSDDRIESQHINSRPTNKVGGQPKKKRNSPTAEWSCHIGLEVGHRRQRERRERSSRHPVGANTPIQPEAGKSQTKSGKSSPKNGLRYRKPSSS